MKLIYICSPYRGNIEFNTVRAQRYCRFACNQGVIPFAPHLHNTQFLDESIQKERETGIRMGLEFLEKCDELWLFGNQLTYGMEMELKAALRLKKTIKYFNDKCEEINQ